MKYSVFLINLPKSVDRLETSDKLSKDQGIGYERVPAVYGADLSDEEITSAYNAGSAGSYYKQLSCGEVGCYLSHRLCWQAIVDRDLDFAVILEDDFLYQGGDFAEIIRLVEGLPSPWYYLKLAGRDNASDRIDCTPMGAFSLCRFRRVPTRTAAQIVSREGARRLLAASAPFSRPVDVDLQYWWEKDIIVHGILPFPFASNSQAESEIQKLACRKTARKSRLRRIISQVDFFLKSHWQARRLLSEERRHSPG